MTLVIDASLVVSALVDGGSTGTWAESLLITEPLLRPECGSFRRMLPRTMPGTLRWLSFLGSKVATLGLRLARAAGPLCGYVTPQAVA